ncbi:hypothetical protein [uncultured Rothia sp.]|uniref:hypothetical protein n=1 Tax=uncultured Rothia sp. TaxID=316088 RepID=UPI0028E90B70|nr:hypothetical protein [uncultured Rothia sp.]
MRTFLIVFWGVDVFGALVRVEYFDSAQPQNAWVKVLVTDEGARVRAVCVYSVQDEAKADPQSAAEFAPVVEGAQVWLGQCPESVEVEGVILVPVSTSVFSYDGNDSRLLQVSSDGSGSSLTYGAAGFVSSVASWGSAEDSAVCFSLLCASADGRVLAAGGVSAGGAPAGGAPAGVPEFGVPSTGASAGAHAGAGAGVGSAAGFDASVMHPLVWDENSFVPRVLGVAGSSMPSVGSLVPGAGSGAGLLDPYGWASLGVAAPAVSSVQGASSGGVPVLPDSLVGVSAASGLVLGSSGFEVLGARVVDSRVARFTAPDPLVAPVGAGWGADPFSLVGGDPVSLVDPWGLSPISFEDYEQYRQERIKNKGAIMAARWLQVAAVAVVVASVFVGGPLIAAIALGAFAGGLEGMAAGLEKTKNGQIDWGQVGLETALGAAKGAITGGVAKVFTHAQVFAKVPVNGATEWIASKAGSSRFVPSIIQKPAQKAASFISARRDSVSKVSWKTKDPAPWVRMQNIAGKYAPEIAGESLSAGVGAVWDYTRKAENFKAEDAAASFLSGTVTGFYKSLITAPVKAKYSAKDTKKTSVYSFAKRTVANDAASRAANASVDWIDKGVQRRLLNDSARNPKPVSERQAERLLVKDFQDAVMGNSKSNFKSAASGLKGAWDDAKDQAKMGANSVTSTDTHEE